VGCDAVSTGALDALYLVMSKHIGELMNTAQLATEAVYSGSLQRQSTEAVYSGSLQRQSTAEVYRGSLQRQSTEAVYSGSLRVPL
jgi:hypothetical protein